jgi:hypothetical protein
MGYGVEEFERGGSGWGGSPRAGWCVREGDPGDYGDSGESESTPESSPYLDDLAELEGLDESEFLTELGNRITRVAAHAAALEYRLLVMIAEFDRRKGWERGGHKDCAAWLEMHTGMSRVTARERVRMARALVQLPKISETMATGELSFSKVRALVRVATPDNEAELIPMARECTASRLEKEVAYFRELERWGDLGAEERRHRRRHLKVGAGADGMVRIRGEVPADVGALLMKALDAAGDALFQGNLEWSVDGGSFGLAVDEVTPDQRRVDALRLVLDAAMASGFCAVGGVPSDSGESVRGPGSRSDLEEETTGADGGEPVSRPGDSPESLDVHRSAAAGASEDADDPDAAGPTGGQTLDDDAGAGADEGSDPDESAELDKRIDSPESLGDHGRLTDSPESVGNHARPNDSPESSTPCGCIPRSPSAERYTVMVHVDHDTLVHNTPGRVDLDGRMPIPPETARRLACDGSVVRIVHGPESEILDVGRKTRVVPHAIRRALWARDGGCRFPGCMAHYVDAHHIVHWADGGKTALANLVLLCPAHHRGVHEGGFSVRMDRAGIPRILNRDGVRIPDQPPAPELAPADPVASLVRTHRFRGIDPGPGAGLCWPEVRDEAENRFRESLDPS